MTYSTAPLTSAPGLDRPVADVMHADPVTVPASASLAEAARTMAERRVHAVLACDEHDAPLGWVTARGMLHNTPRDWTGATAGDGISEALAAVPPTATLLDVLQAFLASGASHVLVRAADDGPVVGLVADSDLLGVLAAAAGEGKR